MEWHEACISSSRVTSRYKTVPPLDPFQIYDCQLEPGVPSFNLGGYLPQLPDDLRLPKGQIADRAEIIFSFIDITELQLSGVPNQHGGLLQITKHTDAETRFHYESDSFYFTGTCKRPVVAGFSVLAKHDPAYRQPRGPRLFSHRNVWNTCLLLLNEYGYELCLTGDRVHRDYADRLEWHAAMPDGTRLSANSPLELLGLATLHRYHAPKIDQEYWWRIEGQPLLSEMYEQWEQSFEETPEE